LPISNKAKKWRLKRKKLAFVSLPGQALVSVLPVFVVAGFAGMTEAAKIAIVGGKSADTLF